MKKVDEEDVSYVLWESCFDKLNDIEYLVIYCLWWIVKQNLKKHLSRKVFYITFIYKFLQTIESKYFIWSDFYYCNLSTSGWLWDFGHIS